MSVDYVALECAECGASFSKEVLYGDFAYQMPSGDQYNLERALGWCNHCALMVAVEDLSDESASERLKQAESYSRRATQKLKRGLLAGLFTSVKSESAETDERIRLLRANLQYLKARTSPARCLDCGSVDIVPLPFPPPPDEAGYEVPAGWNHPLCGGQMNVKGYDFRFNFGYELRLYDSEGREMPSCPE